MTQSGSIYEDLTVIQNLEFFGRVLGVPDGRADDVLRLVDMKQHAGRRVDRLSGGQRARVSLAAALIGRPELLVLDEPTVGLDPVLRRTLWQTFRRLADEEGVTLMISSHVMDEARHCDDLVLLRGGEVLAAGTPDGLCDQTGVRAGDIDAAFLALVDRAGEQ
jgi:ABC-type multidrug transport system ATPase subunit